MDIIARYDGQGSLHTAKTTRWKKKMADNCGDGRGSARTQRDRDERGPGEKCTGKTATIEAINMGKCIGNHWRQQY